MKIDKFLEIEKKYNLHELEINGVNIWMYERFQLWNYELCAENLKLLSSQPSGEKNIADYIKAIWHILVNSLMKHHVKKKNYDVCFIAHERRVKVDDFYKCMYTEEIAEKFENSITLEKPLGFEHLIPVRDKRLIYTDFIVWQGEFLCAFYMKSKNKRYKELYREVKEKFEEPLKEIMREYDVKMDEERIYQVFIRDVIRVSVEKKRYEKLIKKISPKVIVEVVYYCTQCMMINEVANELGIPVIELQHGTMYEEHAAYQYEINKNLKQLPNTILTFSDYWNNMIHMPKKQVEIITTGFPYFEKRKKKVAEQVQPVSGKENILFISQGTISVYLSKLAVELDRIIDKNKYQIFYKLHPSEFEDWEQRCRELSESEICVVDNTDINLYDLFVQSSIQVGVYSTAIYEGLGFGLRTYIYNIAHADSLRRLVEEGYASYVDNAEELKSKIETEERTVEVSEMFWKADAYTNIVDVIKKKVEEA